MAAECAGEQHENLFWEIRPLIYGTQQQWRSEPDADAFFRMLAAPLAGDAAADGKRLNDRARGQPAARLNPDRFARCLHEDGARHRVEANNRMGRLFHISGTPTFFVNGRPVLGAVPPDRFRAILTTLLQAEAQ